MFSRSLFAVALLCCQQSYAQPSVGDSLDSIAGSLRYMENDMIAKQNLSANSPRARDNTAYYQNAIGQLQQQLVAVSRNANQAVAGWRAAERDKVAMQTKTKQLEGEVDRLRREALEQRKLIDQYKAEQELIVKHHETYMSVFGKAIRNGNEADVKTMLNAIWVHSGGKAGEREFDLKIIAKPSLAP